jgi:hypothetical protein
MFARGRQLPKSGSAWGPLKTLVPTFSPLGARMYAFSPSSYWMRAMLHERLGSYSMAVTVAGTPSLLLRLKSTKR